MLKKIIVVFLVLFLVTLVGFFILTANRTAIIAAIVESRTTDALKAQSISPTLFEIVFCGTGSPRHQKDRGQPCTAIVANGRLFVFDAGQGAAQRLQEAQAPFLQLHRVFLTHLHSDHVAGLGDMLHNSWQYGRQHAVEIVGPPGTERLRSGFERVYWADLDERWERLGAETRLKSISMGRAQEITVDAAEITTVYDQDGIVIKAFRVEHPSWSYAFGYRFEYQGKVVVISGDTHYAPNLVKHAQGADVLIHEALNTSMLNTVAQAVAKQQGGLLTPARVMLITRVHTPTLDVAKVAHQAEVKHLVLTHLIPTIPPNGFVEAEFIDGMDAIYNGPITVARDGMRITLAK